MTEMIEQGEPINPTFMYFKLVPKKSWQLSFIHSISS